MVSPPSLTSLAVCLVCVFQSLGHQIAVRLFVRSFEGKL